MDPESDRGLVHTRTYVIQFLFTANKKLDALSHWCVACSVLFWVEIFISLPIFLYEHTYILQISFLKLSHRFEFELSTGSYVLGLNLEIRYNIILISDKNPTYNNNLTNYFQFVLLLVPLDSFQFYVAHYNEQIN